MSEAPKFKMRPARKFTAGPKAGQYVPVPIGGFRTLVGEGTYPVNGPMHKAWLTGSLEIGDYPEPGGKPARKKRSSKKRSSAKRSSRTAALQPTEDTKPAEPAPTEDQS